MSVTPDSFNSVSNAESDAGSDDQSNMDGSGFMDVFQTLANAVRELDGNKTGNDSFHLQFGRCDKDHALQMYRQEILLYSMLGPAVGSIFLFGFLRKRISKWKNCCFGRPGMPYPVKLLEEQNNRHLYVAAFCASVWQILDMLTGNLPFSWLSNVPRAAQGVTHILVSLLIALLHYPIVAALSSNHYIGYVVGTFYIWTMAAIDFSYYQPCWKDNTKMAIIDVFKIAPPVAFYVYLCLALPYKAAISLRTACRLSTAKMQYLTQVNEIDHFYNVFRHYKEFRQSDEHFRKLLSASTYRNMPGFRYGLSILCGTSLAVVAIYMLAVTLLKRTYRNFAELKHILRTAFAQVDATAANVQTSIPADALIFLPGYRSTENAAISTQSHQTEHTTLYYVYVLEVCIYISLLLTFLMTVAAMLATLKQYRHQLLCMYRGVYNLSRYTSYNAPRSTLVSGCKYVGFQISYAFWGATVAFIVFVGVTFSLSFLFTMSPKDVWAFFRYVLEYVGPVLALLVVINIVQHICAQIWFLQKDGFGNKILAIDNRHGFFNFHYFVVYLNTALGMVSCLIRILKAIAVGIWVLPRLDFSAMPRSYEKFDRGFNSFINLVRLENTLTNPTLIVFVSLLQESVGRRRSLQMMGHRLSRDDSHNMTYRGVVIVVQVLGWSDTGDIYRNGCLQRQMSLVKPRSYLVILFFTLQQRRFSSNRLS